ncbi:hypothetical protein HMPREF0305_12306 [Corynebacterium pseudogenitalium ATCC 33035]|uniref:Uncharacterized protein n=1 Tax=Corynebacterium pseudogenitalium ATCC 33035 TaxID=525264 RepID=E2S704_9CORY|nr:hypothetical protein HMPREF0305_12306 [Corynebacterium pseudogenitalium ATCC 33035]
MTWGEFIISEILSSRNNLEKDKAAILHVGDVKMERNKSFN